MKRKRIWPIEKGLKMVRLVTDWLQIGHRLDTDWSQNGDRPVTDWSQQVQVVAKWLQSGYIVGNLRRCQHCSNGYILVTNWRHQFERVHIRGNVVATMLSNRTYLILCPRDRKEANMTLFFSHEILLANVIAAMKHRCCSSEDADVAKIDLMYFNPDLCCVLCIFLYNSFHVTALFRKSIISLNIKHG
jgi:hypothetical protein